MNVPQKSRSEVFAGQLEEKLATFSTDRARVVFLRGLSENWTERYRNFCHRSKRGGSEPYQPGREPATAFDYVDTIALIDARLLKYAEAVPA